MNRGDCIRLEKLVGTPTAIFPTPESKDYKTGEYNPEVSLPIGYSIEGILSRDIYLNESLIMLRFKRNDVFCLGITETSSIVSIVKNILITQNSLYRLTKLPEGTYIYPLRSNGDLTLI